MVFGGLYATFDRYQRSCPELVVQRSRPDHPQNSSIAIVWLRLIAKILAGKVAGQTRCERL